MILAPARSGATVEGDGKSSFIGFADADLDGAAKAQGPDIIAATG